MGPTPFVHKNPPGFPLLNTEGNEELLTLVSS